MKIEKIKHEHKLTKLIQVSLFACLLFAPLLQVAVKSAYVIVNKNANQSYSNNEITHTITNNLETGNKYYFNGTQLTNITQNGYINKTIHCINFINHSTDIDTSQVDNFRIFLQTNGNYEVITFRDNVQLNDFYVVRDRLQISFEFLYLNDFTSTNAIYDYTNYNLFIKENKTNTLDNVFTYAIDQISETNLYNWTENTALYEGVNAMTTQLGITNQVMPILLTYWFFITIIYVIIDIIIAMFTWLTHLLIKEDK